MTRNAQTKLCHDANPVCHDTTGLCHDANICVMTRIYILFLTDSLCHDATICVMTRPMCVMTRIGDADLCHDANFSWKCNRPAKAHMERTSGVMAANGRPLFRGRRSWDNCWHLPRHYKKAIFPRTVVAAKIQSDHKPLNHARKAQESRH